MYCITCPAGFSKIPKVKFKKRLTNEKNHILGLLLLSKRPYKPARHRRLTPIIAERHGVLARLIQRNPTIDLGRYIHDRLVARLLRKQILIPRECPLLQRRLLNTKELSHTAAGRVVAGVIILRDGDAKLLVRNTTVEGLRAVDRGVDLNADVELLPWQKVLLVGRQNAAKGRTGPQPLEVLCIYPRDEDCPKSDEAPSCTHYEGEGMGQNERLRGGGT